GFSKETLKPLLDRMITLDLDVDRKSTRLNSSHVAISYAVFCLKKKNTSALCRPPRRERRRPPPRTTHARGTRSRSGRRGFPPVGRRRAACRWLPLFFFKDRGPPEIYPFPLPAPLQP